MHFKTIAGSVDRYTRLQNPNGRPEHGWTGDAATVSIFAAEALLEALLLS